MLMLITTFGQFLTLLSAIVGDLSYTLFDPRVRVGSGKLSYRKIDKFKISARS